MDVDFATLVVVLASAFFIGTYDSIPVREFCAERGLEGWLYAGCYLAGPICVLLLLRQNPLEYGLKLGPVRQATMTLMVLIVPTIVLVWLASFPDSVGLAYQFPEGSTASSIARAKGKDLLIYLPEEFLFRGFLMLALAKRIGGYAVLVQVIPFVLVHTRKPYPEFIGSLLFALVAGLMVFRFRSIYYSTLLHWVIDIALTFSLYMRR